MFREISEILVEVCALLTYAWTGARVDQPLQLPLEDQDMHSIEQASWKLRPLDPNDAGPQACS
jgi:hypothetical protein